MTYRPTLFLRGAFILIGCTFVAVGPLFDSWMLAPFGLLALFAGGIETRIVAAHDGRALITESSTWRMKYLSRSYDVESGSSLVFVLYPAGSQSGDGISLCDSSTLFLETIHGKRYRIATSTDIDASFRHAAELAESLKIKLKKEEVA